MQFSRNWIPLACIVLVASSCDSPTPPEGPASAQANVNAAGGPGNSSASDHSKIQRGYELAPVPLNVKGKNPSLVGLGSYLVATHACWECHTNPPFAPGGDPFLGQPKQINTAGYLAGGQAFGPFTSRNITPRANGLPAGFTLEEFKLLMRTGRDLKNEHPQFGPLLQVMPWPAFQDLTDHELNAIYEYLSAVPCVVRPDQNPNRCG